MTESEVMERLGLRPFDAAAMQRGDRRSGRTTRMMVHALVAASEGQRVVILCATHRQAEWVLADARAYAVKLGIDPALLASEVPYSERLRGDSRPMFWDHFALGLH